MSYHAYWRLNRLPFGPPQNRDDFFEGTSQREAIARLRFLVGNARSMGLLIGDGGSGKTTLLRHASRNLIWSKIVEPVFVSGHFDDRNQWLQHIADPLGSTSGSWRTICDTLDSASRQDVLTCLLIDDASPTVADVVSSLVNRSRNLTAVLSCDEESVASYVQQIGGCPLRIDLASWSLSDSAGYVRQSILAAGGSAEIFSDAAIVRLHELAEGRVSAIGRLAELALLAGAGIRATEVTPDIVEAVQHEMLVAA